MVSPLGLEVIPTKIVDNKRISYKEMLMYSHILKGPPSQDEMRAQLTVLQQQLETAKAQALLGHITALELIDVKNAYTAQLAACT